jgi:hypothetical protein
VDLTAAPAGALAGAEDFLIVCACDSKDENKTIVKTKQIFIKFPVNESC